MDIHKHGKTSFGLGDDGVATVTNDRYYSIRVPLADLKAFVLDMLAREHPSDLPVEEMVKEARIFIQLDESGSDVSGTADVGYHVLALIEENARLRAGIGRKG